MRTLLLDRDLWDLCTDAAGNIALADVPYAMAQDAASACRLFAGELFYDREPGVPYFDQILGHFPPLALMKSQYEAAAMRVPGVTAARCFLTDIQGRQLSGQIQVTDTDGNVTAAGF